MTNAAHRRAAVKGLALIGETYASSTETFARAL
jgi:hypothetical protein